MPTPSDVKAVAAILESPDWESPEDAARAVIEALDERRRDRMTYGVAINGRPLPHLYTGFENRQEAVRWSKRVGLDVAALDVWVIPVWSKDVILDRHRKMTEELAEKNKPDPPTAGRRKRAA